jgi:hypothetical protein
MRLRAKVRVASAISWWIFPMRSMRVPSPDLGGVAEFYDVLGSDGFRAFLAELTDAFDSGSDPAAFWAQWIDVVVELTPPELDPTEIVEPS